MKITVSTSALIKEVEAFLAAERKRIGAERAKYEKELPGALEKAIAFISKLSIKDFADPDEAQAIAYTYARRNSVSSRRRFTTELTITLPFGWPAQPEEDVTYKVERDLAALKASTKSEYTIEPGDHFYRYLAHPEKTR